MENRWLRGLYRFWSESGIRNERGATAEEFAAFEQRYRVALPADLRAYFRWVNGTAGGSLGMDDDDLFGWWHLDQVRTFAEEKVKAGPDPRQCYVFADYSIWGYAFAVHLAQPDSSPVVVSYGDRHRYVAASFHEFIEHYLSDPRSVLYPPEE